MGRGGDEKEMEGNTKAMRRVIWDGIMEVGNQEGDAA